MNKMIEDIIKDFKSEIMESFPDEYEKGYNAGLKKGIQALEELDTKIFQPQGKIVTFVDTVNASSIGIAKVENYDDKFDEAADNARRDAINETDSIDDLFPAIVEKLEKAGYHIEKLDHHEITV